MTSINIEELGQMWKGFKVYALANCIDTTLEDDYGVWWDCFVAGYKRCDDMINETTYPIEYNSKVMLEQIQQALKEKMMRPRTKSTALYARKADVDDALALPTGNDDCIILFARKTPMHYEDYYTIYVSNAVIKKTTRPSS